MGKEGTNLRKIEAENQCRIALPTARDNTTELYVYAPSETLLDQALRNLETFCAKGLVTGRVYKVKVTGVKDFGAFVLLPGGQETLLHISEASNERIGRMEHEFKVGDVIEVKCVGPDPRVPGQMKISRKAFLEDQGGGEQHHGS